MLLFIASSSIAGVIDDNLTARIHTLNIQQSIHNQNATINKAMLSLIVFAISKQDMQALEQNLKQITAIKVQRLGFMPAFLVAMPANETLLKEIAQYHGVARLSLNSLGEEESLLTSQSILVEPSDEYPNLSNWYAHGFFGQNQTVGLIDSGLAVEHPSLAGKAIFIRQESGSHYDHYLNGVRTAHGTGVACIYAGMGSSSFEQDKGIAFGANTIELGLAGDLDSEGSDELGMFLTFNSLDWLLNRAPKKPDVINYSFGNGDSTCPDCPDWSGMAKVVDYVINHDHILWVKSAGNQGWVEPSKHAPYVSTLTTPADNYNGITVANMNHTVSFFPEGTPNRLYHQITNSSSRGPTKYGRKKPDITAPGNRTRTCAPDPSQYDYIHYSTAMDYRDGYRLMGGTSSAAPHVGASVLLLKSSGIVLPMAIKALLINSADAWDDGGVPVQDAKEPESSHHQVQGSAWNPTYGWGYLNMDKAFQERNNLIYSTLSVTEPKKSFEIYLPAGGKVTLVHERRVGHKKDGKEWALTPLQLDIYDKESHELLAQDKSEIDTVHQVANCHRKTNESTCSHLDKGRYVIVTASLESTSIDGASSEPFVISYSSP